MAKINNENLKKVVDIILENFKKNEDKINDLNVFPVPDGDTGTNMMLTLKSVREELLKLKDFSVKSVLDTASFGALMGARGNSGVILSQILKGFFDIIIKSDNLNLDVLREALKSSKDLAYSSVQDPTEGTMLTTIKDIYRFVEELTDNTEKIKLIELLDKVISEAEKSVERSTFLLPVLKKADVVDAGAQGILDILKGTRIALDKINSADGELKRIAGSAKKNRSLESNGKVSMVSGNPGSKPKSGAEKTAKDRLKEVKAAYDIKYTYCTEFLLKGSKIDVERLKEKIETFGDSAMVVGNESLVKIHVHTNTPHRVLKRAIREGSLHEIQIHNMKDQREEEVEEMEGAGQKAAEEVKKKAALIAVASGEELKEILKSIGTDVIVSGGQSMNPSAYDIVKAINSTDAAEIIIFPNNKNIILTANQAKKIVRDKEIHVVPTKSIPAGISAILSYNPDTEIEENLSNMEGAASKTKSGEITAAVRDANLKVGEIKKGEYIGLSNGKLKVVSEDIVDATVDLIRDVAEGSEEVVTFYTGLDALPEDMENIKKRLKKYYPKMDVEMHKGGQPLYPYIFSIE